MRLFRDCDRLARRAVVVADLRRGRLGPLAFWVGARALRFDPVTVADGMTSIRRGYTPAELRGLLEARRRSRHGRAASGLSAGRHLARPRERLMRTVDATRMRAPAARVLEAAVDVERWPALLPHYRWVRRLERRATAAWWRWRPGGRSARSGIPPGGSRRCGWTAAAPAVHYRHVRGVTTGMDVVWQIESGGRRRPT